VSAPAADVSTAHNQKKVRQFEMHPFNDLMNPDHCRLVIGIVKTSIPNCILMVLPLFILVLNQRLIQPRFCNCKIRVRSDAAQQA
jgi:hypothetical protein